MSSVRVTTPITALTLVPAAITTIDAYDATTDTIVDLRGMKTKGILVQNTGGTNSLTYTILGSYDDGVAYDIVAKTDTAVAHGAQSNTTITDYYSHFQIRVKSTTGSTAGTSISAATPATTTGAGNITIDLNGDGTQTVALGANATGLTIAADIQAKVRALTAATPSNQAAYTGFTAVYASSLYTLTSGTLGTASTVVVTDGATSDVAAGLSLGVPNGGTEAAGTVSASTAQIKLVALGI